METQISSIEKPFVNARHKFEQLCNHLESDQAHKMTHSELESHLQTEGFALLRQLYQDHLYLRSEKEKEADSAMGQDGIKRTQKRSHVRQLETIFGTVAVRRIGYGKCDYQSVHPMDAELNLPPQKYSYGLQKIAAFEAGRSSYDEAMESVNRYTGGHFPKRQMEERRVEVTQDFETFYAQSEYQREMSETLMILSLDGKGIVMRPEDLREHTRRAAEKSQHKLNKRLSRGEKKNRKRMATAATVYSVAPHYRTPSEIARSLYPKGEKSLKPKPEGKRVWASVRKEVATIVEEMFDEALGHDPDQQKKWGALVDGNKTQICLLKEEAKKRGIKLTIIIDIIHVLEYLWKAAYAFFDEGSSEAQNWVTEKLFRILQGKSGTVAAAMRRKATYAKLSEGKRKAIDDCAKYLHNHKPYMKYQQYLSQGYPIATGVIEGVCRHLIKDRMDRTGARWSLQGAEAILKVRSLLSSSDFEAYWEFHEHLEKQRHYGRIRKIFTPSQLSDRNVEKQDYDLRKVG